MKVTINAGGRVVEIDHPAEDGMNVHRLANIAVNTWKRTESDGPEKLGPASYGFSGDRQYRDDFHRTSGYGRQGFREIET